MARSRKRSGSVEAGKGVSKKKRLGSGGANAEKAGGHEPQKDDILKDGSVLCQILSKAGMKIKTSNKANDLLKDQAVFQRDVTLELKRHPDYPEVVNEFTENLVKLIEDPVRLRWSLTPCIVPQECDASCAGGTQDSMMRLLLGVEYLQPAVMNVLLEKLAEFTGDEDKHIGDEAVNIPKLIMNQFRWLDRVINGKDLVEKLFEVQSITPIEVQRELIVSLPEVVDDLQHADVARNLKDLLVQNNQLAVPILDAMSNLTLRNDLVSEVRGSVVLTLPSADLEDLPVIVKFLLQTVSGADDAREVVTELRKNLDLEADAKAKNTGKGKKNKSTARSTECLVMDAVKSAIRFQRTVAEAWIKTIESGKGATEHTILDMCVLFILHSCNYKKPVESLLRNKIRAGYISETLLSATFNIHAEVLQDYFPSVLSIAGVLLCSTEGTISYVGCSVYKHAFNCFDTFGQQEIVGNLVTHIGSGYSWEIDSALSVLDDLVQNSLVKMAPFAVFVKGVLDYLDNLSVVQIRKLYSMLSTLAFKNPREEGMIQDEMHIIIRKQLSNNKPKYKRMGVIGAIMVVKSLAQASAFDPLEESSDGTSTAISSNSYKQVINLLQLVRKSSSKSPETAALFMDELASLLVKGIIDQRVEGWIGEHVIADFQDDFVVDVDPGVKESLVVLPMQLQMGLDEQNESAIAINLLPLLVQSKNKQQASNEDQTRKVSPTFLSPNFRLMQICEKRQNNGSLEGIDALLGCPIQMARKETLEKFSSLSGKEKELFCEVTFLCVNWLREIVNAFAAQDDAEMKSKVMTRMKNITDLHVILKQALAETPNVVPPTACFDIEELGKAAISIGATAGTSGAKKGKKAAGKRNKANKENESDNMDETSRDSTQNETVASQSVTQTGNKSVTQTGNKKATEDISDKVDVDLTRYTPYFREFDIEVFDMLKIGLITRAALDTELNTKDTTTLQIEPPELQLLLVDLHRKLEHALPASAVKKQMFMKRQNDVKNLGFSNLDQLTPVIIVNKMVDLLPALCDHLEGTNAFFQAQITENDGMMDGPGSNNVESQLMATCFQLLLKVLLAIFSWNGLTLPDHRSTLKTGLSVLATRLNTTSSSNQALQDLLKQSFQYLMKFGSTISHMSCAVTLCKLLDSLCQHADPEQHLNHKIGELSLEFLKREWRNADGEMQKGANDHIDALLRLYFKHTEERLVALENIASVGIPELVETENNGCSTTYPTLTRKSFTTYYRCLLLELVDCVKPLTAGKPSDAVEVKMDKLLKWNMAVRIFHILVNLIKIFDAGNNLRAVLKYGRVLVETFVKQAMPLVDVMFRTHKEDVQGLLKNLQISTRSLHHMCGHLKIKRNVSVASEVPKLKRCLEMFVYRVKDCLTLNSCQEAFWLGNLKNRDLQGEEIVQISQQSTVTESNAGGDDSDDSLPADDSDSDVEVDRESTGSGEPAADDQSYSEKY